MVFYHFFRFFAVWVRRASKAALAHVYLVSAYRALFFFLNIALSSPRLYRTSRVSFTDFTAMVYKSINPSAIPIFIRLVALVTIFRYFFDFYHNPSFHSFSPFHDSGSLSEHGVHSPTLGCLFSTFLICSSSSTVPSTSMPYGG